MAAAMTVLSNIAILCGAREGSHYWPGHIFHPSLASKSARDCQIRCDDSYSWYRLNQLLPFECYFQRMSRQATRDPDLLEKTVREALNEVWCWAALGLTCRGLTEECRNCAGEIAKTDVGRFFDVRVMDHLSCCYDRVMASGSLHKGSLKGPGSSMPIAFQGQFHAHLDNS